MSAFPGSNLGASRGLDGFLSWKPLKAKAPFEP